MTSINTSVYSGQYYQLSGSGNTGATSTATASKTASLAQALSGTTDAYQINLSAEAQSYLTSLGTSAASGKTSSLGGADDNFTLSSGQQKQISAILEKYKDEPLTQETFNKIQDDLSAVRLAPDQLAVQDQINSFNGTQLFLDALSGKDSSLDDLTGKSSASKDTKSANYIDKIISQWKTISTQMDSAESGSTA